MKALRPGRHSRELAGAVIKIRWPGEPKDLDLPREERPRPWHKPLIWVSKGFLWHPQVGWTVDMDALTDTAIKCAETIEAAPLEVESSYLWAGVIVRHHNPDALYVLTGETDEDGLFKAVWPD